MYLNGQIAHGVCGAGVEVAVILVRRADTVGLRSLPDFAFQQQRAAEAAGTASAVAVGGNACLFQRDNHRIGSLGIDDLYVVAVQHLDLEGLVFLALGVQGGCGNVVGFALFFLTDELLANAHLCKFTV